MILCDDLLSNNEEDFSNEEDSKYVLDLLKVIYGLLVKILREHKLSKYVGNNNCTIRYSNIKVHHNVDDEDSNK